jgi:hypothetical protein
MQPDKQRLESGKSKDRRKKHDGTARGTVPSARRKSSAALSPQLGVPTWGSKPPKDPNEAEGSQKGTVITKIQVPCSAELQLDGRLDGRPSEER